MNEEINETSWPTSKSEAFWSTVNPHRNGAAAFTVIVLWSVSTEVTRPKKLRSVTNRRITRPLSLFETRA